MSSHPHGAVAQYQRSIATREKSLPESLSGGTVRWSDRPYAFSFRPGLLEIPLRESTEDTSAALAALAAILSGSAGLMGRRLQINWNCSHDQVADALPRYRRPAASGGGLYPIDIYVVARGIDGLPDGLMQYSEARGSLAMLRAGDYLNLVAASCGDDPHEASLYLILSAQYWRNVFKYQKFGYHVINFDCGAMMAALDQTALQGGAVATIHHFFDDAALAGLVGLDAQSEAVLGVVAVQLAPAVAPARPTSSALHPGLQEPIPPPLQRSRLVDVPPLTFALHRETCLAVQPRGESSTLSASPAALPPGSPAQHRTRGSVYGQFDPTSTIAHDAFSRIVQRATVPCTHDVPAHPGWGLTQLMVIVLRVTGLARGVYETDEDGTIGRCVGPAPDLATLQSLYYLDNQNVAGCAAVFVIVGKAGLAEARFGARSIRVLNAQAGMLGQRLYGAAAEAGCGGSAALGFNAVAIDRLCGLAGSPDTALLLYFVGSVLPDASFDFRIAPGCQALGHQEISPQNNSSNETRGIKYTVDNRLVKVNNDFTEAQYSQG